MLLVEPTPHGVTRALAVPVEVVVAGRRFSAGGGHEIRQTGFEITPFRVLGGALAVRSELRIHFRLRGRRVGAGA